MPQILAQAKLGTLTNLDLSSPLIIGVDNIDGKIVYANDRILVKAQTNKVENGIYNIGSDGILVRSSDFATGSSQIPSTVILIQEGLELADTGWVLSTDSGNSTVIVGSAEIEFSRFSLNQNILGIDLPSSIVLRSEKGYPLTIAELDNNFKYLSVSLTQKLNIVDFTQKTICDRINSVDYSISAINANNLRGFYPSTEVIEDTSTIALRTTAGNITSTTFTGDLIGNADTADFATMAQTAHALDAINPVLFGGTGASTAAGARLNLGAVNIAGDTLTGKLTLAPSSTANASLNIPAGSGTPNTLFDGDIWTSPTQMFYRASGNTYTFASLQSPAFVGTPTAPTPDQNSNSNAISTTQYVQGHVATLNSAINLKSNINSPTFTGDPRAPTPSTNDNDTSIATTAFVVNKLAATLPSYYTKPETDNLLSLEKSARISGDKNLQDQVDELMKMRGIPIGTVMYYAAASAPIGWLKCDGALVSKYAFPQLFNKIGYTYGGSGNDFRLPDLRGEFLRGWDDGRGVDSGRTFGTWQKGTLNVTDPNYGSFNTPGIIGRTNYAGGTSGVVDRQFVSEVGQDYVTSDLYPNALLHWFNGSNAPIELGTLGFSFGATRPRNVVMLPCIKAYGDIDNPDLINATAVLESIGYKVDKRGDIMSGRLTLSADPINPLHAATKQYVDVAITRVDNRVAKAGDTMSGYLNLHANPTQPMHAATKDYVDTIVKSQPIALSLDTRGLNTNQIASLLNTIAPPSNYAAYTLCRIAATSQNVSSSTTNYRAGWISITYVYWVNTATTVYNPDRNNNLVYRVNSTRTSWEYVSG